MFGSETALIALAVLVFDPNILDLPSEQIQGFGLEPFAWISRDVAQEGHRS
jgi:hypothetical protein